MKTFFRASIAASLLVLGTAYADEASVKQTFLQRFPNSNIDSVAKTPIAGLYEVLSDGRIWYADEEVNYVIQGTLVEAKTRRNITSERLGKLTAVPFDTLPLDLAVKMVKGNGKRKLAIFEDPDCPFCKQVERELSKVSDVTVYVFLLPIEQLHPGATEKSKKIWCAPDRAKAWLDAVLNNVVPDAPATCETPLEKVAQLGKTLRISGTPTLFFADGNRVAGAMPAAQLESRLNAASKEGGLSRETPGRVQPAGSAQRGKEEAAK